jgi:C4-dicarboxylate-specific signal transduction histidine kinase
MNFLFNDSATPTYSRAHIELFRHMLATPLTTLEYLVEEIIPSHNTITWSKKKSAVSCFKRIKDTLSYFTEIRKRKADTFTVESLLSSINMYYVGEDKNITFNYQSAKSRKLKIKASRFLMEEVFICLINNALEAQSNFVSPFISITVFIKNSSVYFAIRDYGYGIPWWQQFIVSKPFISFKRQGTGVGLSFAQEVITKKLNGSLKIYSRVGFGTEVICSLPLNH